MAVHKKKNNKLGGGGDYINPEYTPDKKKYH